MTLTYHCGRFSVNTAHELLAGESRPCDAAAMVCYACDPANPDRAATHGAAGTTLRVPARFEGPPGNVNGGMAVGLLACPALESAARDGRVDPFVARITARLHRSVPHSNDLFARAVRRDDAPGVTLHDDGDMELAAGTVTLIERGRRSEALPADLAALVSELSTVSKPTAPPFFEENGDHPIAGCFSCGPDNGRGLRIFPRFAAEGVTWASWSPDASFVDGGATLATSIIASALDCSSGICLPREEQQELLRTDRFYLLGSLDVRYLRAAPVRANYRVVAKAGRREGRKFFGTSALFDDAGTAYATAEAIWIIVQMTRTQAFGGDIPGSLPERQRIVDQQNEPQP